MTKALSNEQILKLRTAAQRLAGAARAAPAGAAERLGEIFCVQAQELKAGLLSVQPRSRGLTAAAIEQARVEARSLVWTWSLRGTLHLTTRADALWLVPLLSDEAIARDRRRFQQMGWDEDRYKRGRAVFAHALEKHPDLTQAEVAALLQANHLPWEGQAAAHFIYRAAFEGVCCRGPVRGKKITYVLLERWAGALQARPRAESLARLARRYLAAYGPATATDLARWSGLKLGEARQAVDLIRASLDAVTIGGEPGWVLKEQLAWLDEPGPVETAVNLLPRWDTYFLGYADRSLFVEAAYAARLNAGGGVIHPALLVNGRVAGMWRAHAARKALEVRLTPFEALDAAVEPLLQAEVADLGRFLGVEARLA